MQSVTVMGRRPNKASAGTARTRLDKLAASRPSSCAPVTFSDMWQKRSGLLSLGGDLDYLPARPFCRLSQKSTRLKTIHLSLFPASRPYHRRGAVIRSGWGAGWVGGAQTVRLVGRLQPESSSVCPVCLFQFTYGGCRPVLSQRALWKDRNVMLIPRHRLQRSLSAVAMLYLPSWPLCPPYGETLGARRRVTAVSGMLDGRCSPFPGLPLHLRLSDTGVRVR